MKCKYSILRQPVYEILIYINIIILRLMVINTFMLTVERLQEVPEEFYRVRVCCGSILHCVSITYKSIKNK